MLMCEAYVLMCEASSYAGLQTLATIEDRPFFCFISKPQPSLCSVCSRQLTNIHSCLCNCTHTHTYTHTRFLRITPGMIGEMRIAVGSWKTASLHSQREVPSS